MSRYHINANDFKESKMSHFATNMKNDLKSAEIFGIIGLKDSRITEKSADG